jgi:hypothetical protein
MGQFTTKGQATFRTHLPNDGHNAAFDLLDVECNEQRSLAHDTREANKSPDFLQRNNNDLSVNMEETLHAFMSAKSINEVTVAKLTAKEEPPLEVSYVKWPNESHARYLACGPWSVLIAPDVLGVTDSCRNPALLMIVFHSPVMTV